MTAIGCLRLEPCYPRAPRRPVCRITTELGRRVGLAPAACHGALQTRGQRKVRSARFNSSIYILLCRHATRRAEIVSVGLAACSTLLTAAAHVPPGLCSHARAHMLSSAGWRLTRRVLSRDSSDWESVRRRDIPGPPSDSSMLRRPGHDSMVSLLQSAQTEAAAGNMARSAPADGCI